MYMYIRIRTQLKSDFKTLMRPSSVAHVWRYPLMVKYLLLLRAPEATVGLRGVYTRMDSGTYEKHDHETRTGTAV